MSVLALSAAFVVPAERLAASPYLLAAAKAEAKAEAKSGKSDKMYRRGVAAIDAERWDDAVEIFRQIAREGPQQDRAQYWLAYALHEDGRAAEALAAVRELRQKYPKSRWIDDSKALEIEIREASGDDVQPDDVDDEDLKVLAISSLLGSDQERAVTLLEKVLSSKASDEAKEKALFVLSQSSSPRASKLMESIARGSSGEDLQEEAIRMLGISHSPRNRALLLDVLNTSKDRSARTAALHGLMITGDRATLFNVAKGDKDAEIRGEAVQLLGVIGAKSELDSLYRTETSHEVKERIIQGYFISGSVDRLIELARTEKNSQLRTAAIQGLGTMSMSRTGAVLQQLWNSEKEPQAKEAILGAFMIQGNARALIDLMKRETDRGIRRSIAAKLAVMPSKEAREFMQGLLK